MISLFKRHPIKTEIIVFLLFSIFLGITVSILFTNFFDSFIGGLVIGAIGASFGIFLSKLLKK